jgi:23S rRNA (pseudouridine1915-N3)-methyltransferase
MKLVLAAVGRLKDGPERELFQRYWTRTEGLGRKLGLTPLQLVEISESKAASAATRKSEEAKKLLAAVAGLRLIALEVRGRALTTEAFAADLASHRDGGAGGLAYLIGGPDGHGPEIAAAGAKALALSALTLPHGLARVILAEQLYRAATLLSGHPYHRA